MISIITPNGILGGFTEVTTHADHYDAGGTLYYFDVIGSPHSLGEFQQSPVAPIVPQSVTPRQIRMALSRTSYNSTTLRAAVESAVAAGDQDLKDWYEQSTEFFKNNPNVIGMGTALGVGKTGIDNLFILASTL